MNGVVRNVFGRLTLLVAVVTARLEYTRVARVEDPGREVFGCATACMVKEAGLEHGSSGRQAGEMTTELYRQRARLWNRCLFKAYALMPGRGSPRTGLWAPRWMHMRTDAHTPRTNWNESAHLHSNQGPPPSTWAGLVVRARLRCGRSDASAKMTVSPMHRPSNIALWL